MAIFGDGLPLLLWMSAPELHVTIINFKLNQGKAYMLEEEILNQIPCNWADDIEKAELNVRAAEIRPSVIIGFAEQLGLKTTGSLDKIIIRLAKAHGVTKKKERESLKNTCIQSAKMDIFADRYGHLFPKDENGELSYSLPMLKKISGLTLMDS